MSAIERRAYQEEPANHLRPPIPLLRFELSKPTKLTISPTEIKEIAEKKGISPRELMKRLVQERAGRQKPMINAEDPYVVLSKEEDFGIFVSSTHKTAQQAFERAAEATYNMHIILKDGKYPPGSPQDMVEEKPPKYYAYDMEGNQLQKKEKSSFEVAQRTGPMINKLHELFANGKSSATHIQFSLNNSPYEIELVNDNQGKAVKASQTIKLTDGKIYVQEIILTDYIVSSRLAVVSPEGKLISRDYNRNNDAALVQAKEFTHSLEIHLPKKV